MLMDKSRRLIFTAALLSGCGVLFAAAGSAATDVVQRPHSPHPNAHARPPHRARFTPTPLAACPGAAPVACPQPAACVAHAKVWKLFYAYPARNRSVRALGNFSLDPRSNGLDPVHDGGSLTVIDDNGATILQMPTLNFQKDGNTFTAINSQGSVSVWPFARQYSFEFTFNTPNFPSDFFRFRYHVCLNIGNDGFQESIVCQQKPRGGFVCHE